MLVVQLVIWPSWLEGTWCSQWLCLSALVEKKKCRKWGWIHDMYVWERSEVFYSTWFHLKVPFWLAVLNIYFKRQLRFCFFKKFFLAPQLSWIDILENIWSAFPDYFSGFFFWDLIVSYPCLCNFELIGHCSDSCWNFLNTDFEDGIPPGCGTVQNVRLKNIC